jgi:hypothetical protein
MKFSSYSLSPAPASLPSWQTSLDDLGNPHPARVAQVLGLGARTVYRYNREGQAPRHVCLALSWLTEAGATNEPIAGGAYGARWAADGRPWRSQSATALKRPCRAPATPAASMHHHGGSNASTSGRR